MADRQIIRVGLLRHYWQNGENAVWRADPDMPSVVLEGVKKDYAVLEATRPAAAEFGGMKVLFHFEDEKDRYGRNATALAGAAIPVGSSELLEVRARRALVASDRSSLQLVVEGDPAPLRNPAAELRDVGGQPFREAQASLTRKSNKLGLITGALVSLAIGIGVSVWLVNSPPTSPEQPLASAAAGNKPASDSTSAASIFCRKDWARIQAQLSQAGDAPANCLVQDAAAICSDGPPEGQLTFATRVSRQHSGYCALYAARSASEMERAARQDLGAMVRAGRLAERDAADWATALLGIAYEHETLLEPPEPVEAHRRIDVSAPGNVMADIANIMSGLKATWNDALPDALAATHAIKDNADAVAIGEIYLKDYCHIVGVLANSDPDGSTAGADSLRDALRASFAEKRIDVAKAAAQCQRADKAGLKFPDSLSVTTGVPDRRGAISRMVAVVDFCGLLPDLADLQRRGMSPLVRSCQDVAQVLGVPWR